MFSADSVQQCFRAVLTEITTRASNLQAESSKTRKSKGSSSSSPITSSDDQPLFTITAGINGNTIHASLWIESTCSESSFRKIIASEFEKPAAAGSGSKKRRSASSPVSSIAPPFLGSTSIAIADSPTAEPISEHVKAFPVAFFSDPVRRAEILSYFHTFDLASVCYVNTARSWTRDEDELIVSAIKNERLQSLEHISKRMKNTRSAGAIKTRLGYLLHIAVAESKKVAKPKKKEENPEENPKSLSAAASYSSSFSPNSRLIEMNIPSSMQICLNQETEMLSFFFRSAGLDGCPVGLWRVVTVERGSEGAANPILIADEDDSHNDSIVIIDDDDDSSDEEYSPLSGEEDEKEMIAPTSAAAAKQSKFTTLLTTCALSGSEDSLADPMSEHFSTIQRRRSKKKIVQSSESASSQFVVTEEIEAVEVSDDDGKESQIPVITYAPPFAPIETERSDLNFEQEPQDREEDDFEGFVDEKGLREKFEKSHVLLLQATLNINERIAKKVGVKSLAGMATILSLSHCCVPHCQFALEIDEEIILRWSCVDFKTKREGEEVESNKSESLRFLQSALSNLFQPNASAAHEATVTHEIRFAECYGHPKGGKFEAEPVETEVEVEQRKRKRKGPNQTRAQEEEQQEQEEDSKVLLSSARNRVYTSPSSFELPVTRKKHKISIQVCVMTNCSSIVSEESEQKKEEENAEVGQKKEPRLSVVRLVNGCPVLDFSSLRLRYETRQAEDELFHPLLQDEVLKTLEGLKVWTELGLKAPNRSGWQLEGSAVEDEENLDEHVRRVATAYNDLKWASSVANRRSTLKNMVIAVSIWSPCPIDAFDGKRGFVLSSSGLQRSIRKACTKALRLLKEASSSDMFQSEKTAKRNELLDQYLPIIAQSVQNIISRSPNDHVVRRILERLGLESTEDIAVTLEECLRVAMGQTLVPQVTYQEDGINEGEFSGDAENLEGYYHDQHE